RVAGRRSSVGVAERRRLDLRRLAAPFRARWRASPRRREQSGRVSDIAYAQSGETQVAYRAIGGPGRVDVVVVAGALFPLETLAEDRVTARFLAGLAALGRLVVFDKRGVGLSDPITDWSRSVQEQWADDLLAVIDAANLVEPVVVSWEPFGVARIAAAARP